MSSIEKKPAKETPDSPSTKPMCGVIMPISAMDGYPAEHWSMVQTILYEAITSAGFQADLVSNSDEVSVIQKNIIQNIYNNEIIVCDISGRNANVMFELGMRLTFDKPIVIVKDDVTATPFDTSIVEYIQYRKDLRYGDIQEFKEKLKAKILFTHKKKDEPGYSPFIKHFGNFTVPKLNQKEVEPINYLIERFDSFKYEIRAIIKMELENEANRLSASPKRFAYVAATKDDGKENFYNMLSDFLNRKMPEIALKKSEDGLEDWLTKEFIEFVPEAKKYEHAVKRWIIEDLVRIKQLIGQLPATYFLR